MPAAANIMAGKPGIAVLVIANASCPAAAATRATYRAFSVLVDSVGGSSE